MTRTYTFQDWIGDTLIDLNEFSTTTHKLVIEGIVPLHLILSNRYACKWLTNNNLIKSDELEKIRSEQKWAFDILLNSRRTNFDITFKNLTQRRQVVEKRIKELKKQQSKVDEYFSVYPIDEILGIGISKYGIRDKYALIDPLLYTTLKNDIEMDKDVRPYLFGPDVIEEYSIDYDEYGDEIVLSNTNDEEVYPLPQLEIDGNTVQYASQLHTYRAVLEYVLRMETIQIQLSKCHNILEKPNLPPIFSHEKGGRSDEILVDYDFFEVARTLRMEWMETQRYAGKITSQKEERKASIEFAKALEKILKREKIVGYERGDLAKKNRMPLKTLTIKRNLDDNTELWL